MTSWRAVDTAAVRHQVGVAKLLASAYHPAAFSRGLGLGWLPGPDGTEVDGVTAGAEGRLLLAQAGDRPRDRAQVRGV